MAILWSENAMCSKQTTQNSDVRKLKFCTHKVKKFSQCHGKSAFRRFSMPNWAILRYSALPHSSRNREYLAPQIHSMNNWFHSEAKLSWSCDYLLTNHIATNKSSANHKMPLFSRLYPSFGYLRKIFLPRGLKYSLFCAKFHNRGILEGLINIVYSDQYRTIVNYRCMQYTLPVRSLSSMAS